MWCSDTAQIFFEDVRVPKSHIIGEEGKGFLYQMLQFQEERLFAAASCKQTFVPYLLGLNIVFCFYGEFMSTQYLQGEISTFTNDV